MKNFKSNVLKAAESSVGQKLSQEAQRLSDETMKVKEPCRQACLSGNMSDDTAKHHRFEDGNTLPDESAQLESWKDHFSLSELRRCPIS
ncbi:hypothetical protein QYM36_019801 [Artemia franciscana]|uniref:Uncharacterized protein n=1 Tax=Artemia franciscana TaxID=6661 RepID=A0AA88H4Q3_ARTSF|nr:hypothetical protein QYM36_019801 [Artemia franciscana]